MKNSKQSLNLKIKKYLLYLLPIVLFFSYYPIIAIGKNSSMNLEFSLPLVWLLIFAIISIPSAIQLFKDFKLNFLSLSLLFPLYSTISLLWTPNFLRGILTAGIIWCLWLSLVSIYDFFHQKTIKNDSNFRKNILKIIFISTFIVCCFCWLQCILDILGVSREATLLCLGCTSKTFGFPHPNGFAIEPQFMGNLLLLPVLLTLYLFITEKNKKQKLFFLASSLFFAATLFLTFSRGAIFSFCLALAILLTLLIVKKKSFRPLISLPLIALAFLISLTFQGLFASLSSTNDTFLTGISKSINQLSLGFIDLKLQNEPVENFSQKTEVEPVENSENSAVFDGYVEESTNTRLSLSSVAFEAWTSAPNTFIFGFGLGSSGTILNFFSDYIDWDKEITQNEFFEIALELGMTGVLLTAAIIVFIILKLKNNQNSPLFFSILVGFLFSYLFFSGLPNALHIFLLPVLLFFTLKNQFIIDQKT